MPAIVLSRVTPALWTTTSTPLVRLRQLVADPLRRAGIGDVQRDRGAAEAARHALQVLLQRRDVEPDHVGAVARQRLGDRLADPARRAGHQRHLAGQRLLPVKARFQLRLAGADPHDLGGDVGAARREQEAQRRGELVLGARLDVHELRRRAAPHLLGGGADEALQRALRRVRARGFQGARPPGNLGRRSEDDHAAVRLQPPDRRVEERVQRDQLLAGRDPGGVEHERLEALVAARGRVPHLRAQLRLGRRDAQRLVQLGVRLCVRVGQHPRGGAREPAAGRAAEQHGP